MEATFADATAVAQIEPGRFLAQIDPAWTVGGKPNGGYLMAMLGRAASQVGEHAHITAATAQFLRAPEPAEAAIEVEIVAAGRSATRVRARLVQDGTCVEALLTMGQLQPEPSVHWDHGVPSADHRPYEACARLESEIHGLRFALLDQVDLRLEPASCGFVRGAPTGRGELRGWLALPGGTPFDPCSLLFAVDAFPAATFDIELAGWVPTMELTTYIRALPCPGPVRFLQRAQLIAGQRVDEACFVWDTAGTLVAQAVQLAAIRLG